MGVAGKLRPPQRMTLPPSCGVERVQFWLRNALPGDELVYHHGLLARDRLAVPGLDAIAAYLIRQNALGSVALLQQAHGGQGRYIARKRAPQA